MDLQLKNKIIIVTGGSKGIGLGITQQLVAEGAIPIIVGRNLKSIQKEIANFKKEKYDVGYVIAELTDPHQCQQAIEKVIKEYGTIDGLVNNAGVNDGIGLENGSYETFVQSLHRNLVHYYLMAHHALPYLKKTKGAIVNIGSKVAETGQGNTSGYAAANGGRNALTREWAVELLPYSIRVNTVIVAECYTPLYEKWIQSFPNPEAELKKIEAKIPLEKRMTKREEIAAMVVFLLSQRSSHTTGQLLYIDGGYTHLDRSIN